MRNINIFILVLLSSIVSVAYGQGNIPEHLQAISVTVKTPQGTGSGTLVTRKIDGQNVTFVIGCAHVVDGLRKVRDTIDIKTGQVKKVVEFADADILKQVVENGRHVGDFTMKAKVIKYSDSELGDDLSVLMLRKKDFIKDGATFYLDGDKIVGVSTEVYHVGSLFGEFGSASFMTGSISSVGRIIPLNNGVNTIVVDQVNVGAVGGSSGGGVFKKDGKLCGILVRGGGPSFGLMVPIRVIHKNFSDHNMLWVIDPNVKAPTMKEIEAITVE